MCLGPDAKGEFGVGRRAIRRESGASGGTGGARMGGRCAVEKLAGVPRGSKAQSIEAISSALASARARKAEKQRVLRRRSSRGEIVVFGDDRESW